MAVGGVLLQRKAGRIFSQPFYGGLHCGLRSPCGVCPPDFGELSRVVAELTASHRAYRWRTLALRVSNPTSGTCDSHHATGGVYKAQEHIRRVKSRRFCAIVLVCLLVRSSTYFCLFGVFCSFFLAFCDKPNHNTICRGSGIIIDNRRNKPAV